MLSFLSERRAGIALLVILLSLLVLMAYQKKFPDQSTLLERTVFEALSPAVVAVSSGIDRFAAIRGRYADLASADKRSRDLARKVENLSRQVKSAKEAIQENRRLRALLDFREEAEEEYVAASVLSVDPRAPFDAVWIDRGRADGVRRHVAVVVPEGVVGKVLEVAAHACKVQLLTNVESGVGAMVQRSRSVGVVFGDGEDRLLLKYLRHLDDVRVGDVVITSGLDGIFSRGLGIGRVLSVETTPDQARRVTVAPFVDVKNIEHVLVSLGPTESAPFVALLPRRDAQRTR